MFANEPLHIFNRAFRDAPAPCGGTEFDYQAKEHVAEFVLFALIEMPKDFQSRAEGQSAERELERSKRAV